MQEENKVDMDLYSRQIGTFGMEAMTKLIKLKILIVGMRGLGVEVAKNLILAGPAIVDLHDNNQVTWGDLSSNFYTTEAHVGKKTRAEASFGKLQELNPYVNVSVVSNNVAEIIKNYNVIVVTEMYSNIQEVTQWNETARALGIGFILSQNLGLAGYTFLDFGDKFQIFDRDGEAPVQYIVTNITQGNPGIVTVHEDKRLKIGDDDHVIFREVQGMESINGLEPIGIQVIDGFSFKLKTDTTNMPAYTREGIIDSAKVHIDVSFHNLSQSYPNPVASSQYGMLETPDFRNFGRSEQLHIGILAVWRFQTENGRLPNGSEEDTNKVFELAKVINTEGKENDKINVEELDEKVIKNTGRFAQNEICAQCAFFGGIVAQEVVKFTGKYTPMKQWLHYDIFECLPEGEVDRTPENGRYDDQIRVFGREIQQKLSKVNVFMVGAGALGCEYIKAFALMGVGCSKEGLVSCTDNDNIEVSNLNRQFLFRQANVGKSKSETACLIAKEMNPSLNVRDYQTRVGSDTEDVFNEKFWNSLNFVVNAVDNIHARLYVDARCVWFKKHLLESGTLGTKANSQMIIPHKTQCYGDSQDPPEESIPMCTLRNFPNQIEHCIEWGRHIFGELFDDRPNDVINYLKDPTAFIKHLKTSTTTSGQKDTLEAIQKIINNKKSASFDLCLELARTKFEEYYNNTIQQLLFLFPADYKDKDGQAFWSGPKRAPTAIAYDQTDPLHVEYVFSAANLYAFIMGIPQNTDKAYCAKAAGAVKIVHFQPKSNVYIQTEEKKGNEEEKKQEAQPEEEEVLAKLLEVLSIPDKTIKPSDIAPADFEKDDDTNYHIDFINAASNLRARNYRIVECDRQKTKMIAGKIIPAIATTTAMITGTISAEMYKVVQGFEKLDLFKNAFINLALPLFVFTEPDEPKKTKTCEFDPILCGPVKAIPENYTIWDTIVIKGSMTIGEFLEKMKTDWNVNISLIASGTLAMYNSYLPGGRHEARKSKKIEDVYNEISDIKMPAGKTFLHIDVSAEFIDDDSDVTMPAINYIFG